MYTKESIDKLIKKINYCIEEEIRFNISEDKLSIIIHPITITDFTNLSCVDTEQDYSLKTLKYKFA